MDFDTHMVVVIFGGESLQSSAVRLLSIKESDGDLVVTYGTTDPRCGTEPKTRSCALALVRRSDRPLSIIRERHNMIGMAPIRERVAHLK